MYLDTSVLAKLFLREPDSEFYGQLTDGQEVCSSVLAYTEVWSAMLAKERGGGMAAVHRHHAWESFDEMVMTQVIELLPMSPAILKRANRIMESCHPRIPLRSLDALHLATCDQSQDWPLATHDRRMRDAALFLGFPVTALPE